MEAWEELPEALLRCEVARSRIARNAPPDPFAGLKLSEQDVDRLLAGPEDSGVPREVLKDIERARGSFDKALTASGLGQVVANAALSDAEAEVLALLAAIERSPRRQRLVGYVLDDVNRTRPTLHLLERIFGDAGPLAVAFDSRLRRAALVTVGDEGAWASRSVDLAAMVTWALAGDGSLDPGLPADATPMKGLSTDGDRLVFVTGEDRVRRLQAAVQATAAPSFLLVSEPATDVEWDAVIRTATIFGVGVVLEVGDALSKTAKLRLERADHVAWAVSSKSELALDELPLRPWVETRAEAAEASTEEWEAAIGEADRNGHRLTADQLRLVSSSLGRDRDVEAGIRRLASGSFDKMAIRIRPRRTWDDLILAPDKLAGLHELTSRYRHRDVVHGEWGFPAIPASGLVAMFSGPSGTGKTLSAEVVAGDLGLDLFKIDLSSIVSKYIGETEKNLEKVFGAATATNTVLFFDEADSMFGKRSEVTDARDRYANMEVSYLLQRLEAYDGMVVLATNFSKNLDDAFLRRIHVAIEFPMPAEAERRAIWQHAIPKAAPVKDIDFDFLARQFDLAGGSIKGAALHAAFLAAEARQPITMEMVMMALKREFQKLGRLRTQTEFGPYTALVNS